MTVTLKLQKRHLIKYKQQKLRGHHLMHKIQESLEYF